MHVHFSLVLFTSSAESKAPAQGAVLKTHLLFLLSSSSSSLEVLGMNENTRDAVKMLFILHFVAFLTIHTPEAEEGEFL